ncbi:MAG: hypothetical protein NVSMB46_01770 [Candidatus Saccharimonadales bacterium]
MTSTLLPHTENDPFMTAATIQPDPSTTKSLNTNQRQLLKLHYIFRFTTASLLSAYKNTTVSCIKRSLALLHSLGYVDRHYDSSYKLLHKPAQYYLTPKALRLLRDQDNYNEAVLHSFYKNKSVSQEFIAHTLEVFRIYVAIRTTTHDLRIYTKYEMNELQENDDFPHMKPDLYVKSLRPTVNAHSYFIDVVINVPLFLIKKRIKSYVEHYESGEWTNERYPTVVLICGKVNLLPVLQTYIERLRDDHYLEDDELKFIISSAHDASDIIW